MDYTVQRIETDAHTRPFTAGAQFSLSVGDEEGSWVLFDEAETFGGPRRGADERDARERHHGGSVVTRSRPAPGLDERLDLSTRSTRTGTTCAWAAGLSVWVESDLVEHNVTGGGKQSLSYPTEALKTDSTVDTYYYAAYGPKTLPLCRADDPWTPAYYDGGPRGDDLRQAPLYKLDTSLSGAVGPAIGDARPRAAPRRRGGDASIDWRAYGLKRGDYIRVGHPRTGETFRVSTDPAKEFSDTTVPLAQADDAMLEAGLRPRRCGTPPTRCRRSASTATPCSRPSAPASRGNEPHRGVRLGLGLPPQVRRRDDGGDRGGRRARLHGLGRRRDGHRGRARDARGSSTTSRSRAWR